MKNGHMSTTSGFYTDLNAAQWAILAPLLPAAKLAGRFRRVADDPPWAACCISGMGELSPIESEFATTEDAEAYDAWFRAKVAASRAEGR